MTFAVEIHGRLRTVVVEPVGAAGPAGGRFRLRVDGEPFEVSANPTDLGLSIVFAGGRALEAAVTPMPGGTAFIQFPHVSLTATMDGRWQGGGEGAGAAGGDQRVLAPMPGKIVRLLVKLGDLVEPRQGLVVIEAMKMENELGSTRAGRVTEVAVAEGASVEAGRLLVVVAPEAAGPEGPAPVLPE